MNIEVAPEELLWDFLEERISHRHEEKHPGSLATSASAHRRQHSPSPAPSAGSAKTSSSGSEKPAPAENLKKRPWPERARKHILSLLPEQIEVSEEFVASWKHFVHTTVQNEIVQTFKLRPFLFLENDQTLRLKTTDPDFWNRIDLSFSHVCVQRLWEILRNVREVTRPQWLQVTPSDALILRILVPHLHEFFPFEWLATENAPWIVVAILTAHYTCSNPKSIPWRPYLLNPSITPLPLRELLIEHTANLYKSAIVRLEEFINAESTRPPASHRQDASNQPGLTGASPGRMRGNIDFFFHDHASIEYLQSNNAFEAEQVKAAIRSWFNEASLGLDDTRYLESTAAVSGFFESIETLQRLLREFRTTHESVIKRNPS